MPVVGRIVSSSATYISPTVDRACNALPLLGDIKQRVEPYAPPLIQKADICIDTVIGMVEYRTTALRNVVNSAGGKALSLKDAACTVVEERAAGLRDVVSSTQGKAQKMISESIVVARVHKTSLAIVDTLDIFIDRYLPEPEMDDETKETKIVVAQGVIPRMLQIPFKIPVRMIHISIAKARIGCDVIQVRIQWASDLTLDQKAKLQAFILSKSQTIADKVSSSSFAMTLRQGKQNTSKTLQAVLENIDGGKKAVGVKCYIVCERLHIIETRDWVLKMAGTTQQTSIDRTSELIVAASQRVFDATSFVAGKDRATGIFTLVGKRLPFVKVVIHASASTGSLSESSSEEVPPKIESSTGATLKVSAQTEGPGNEDALDHDSHPVFENLSGEAMKVIAAQSMTQELIELEAKTD